MSKKSKIAPLLIVVSTIAIAFFLITPSPEQKDKNNPFGDISKLSEVQIPILMYHYVEYNLDEEDFLRDQQNVPPHVFEQQLIDLKESGHTFITLSELSEVMENPENEKHVILTFDDGFKDFYTDAYPILKKHNIPAVAYIVYNFLGGQDYMTEEMVKEIAQDGLVEIGSHTLHHAYLLDIEESVAEYEISQSKQILEKELGVEVTSFAYPYGDFDERAIKLAKKAGYTNAVTVEPGNHLTPTGLFKLPRIRLGHLTGDSLINYINR